MTKLTPKLRQLLKAKAHKLKPIVFIGNNGLTENVMNEIDRGLTDHELIKIRIQGADREEKKLLLNNVCDQTISQPVQLIGGIAIIYRKKMEEN